MTTPNTDAHTDAAPLMPQRNAVGVSGRPDAARIPMTNGMPIAKLIGASSTTASAMRTGVVAPSLAWKIPGVTSPNRTTTPSSTSSGTSSERGRSVFTNRSVAMLPSPLKSSTVKRTTASE